ncbi:hypothetical protein C8E97_3971 [Saccharothrix australiensis]|uniref:Uncharacterized protein n=2 Tax=Saccharothrix australiensis TaxID=2072 RepID=A0A495W682_9PSEU|nr:hypothetical protein C8E97_3971 [Saccharothrix australiensis]
MFGDGDISCVVRARQEVPRGMDISLLSYVVLTGQPSMSRMTEGAVNPFIGTGGVYEAVRTLDLGEHGHLSTAYRVEPAGEDRLRAVFQVDGEVDVPRLVSIAPTIETWTPVAPGRIDGQFVMVWTGRDGERVRGKTDTSYVLPTEEGIPGQQFREIRINIAATDDELRQTEHIVLFSPALLEQTLHSAPAPIDSLKDIVLA